LRAFVTGGAGFIGSNLVRRLLTNPDNQVTVFDNLSSGKESNLPLSGQLTLIKAHALDLAALKEAVAGHDIVFHLSTNPDTARGLTETDLDLKQGTIATYNWSRCESMTSRELSSHQEAASTD
jgi:UDP-glucose 4-epimerase